MYQVPFFYYMHPLYCIIIIIIIILLAGFRLYWTGNYVAQTLQIEHVFGVRHE